MDLIFVAGGLAPRCGGCVFLVENFLKDKQLSVLLLGPLSKTILGIR